MSIIEKALEMTDNFVTFMNPKPDTYNNFIIQLILEMKLTHWSSFGHTQSYLTTPNWNDWVNLLLLWMSDQIQKLNFKPQLGTPILSSDSSRGISIFTQVTASSQTFGLYKKFEDH